MGIEKLGIIGIMAAGILFFVREQPAAEPHRNFCFKQP
jgi:hypothetical protein